MIICPVCGERFDGPFSAMAHAWDEGAVAGWNQSGEGFNAEYPDESTGECSVDLNENPHRKASK